MTKLKSAVLHSAVEIGGLVVPLLMVRYVTWTVRKLTDVVDAPSQAAPGLLLRSSSRNRALVSWVGSQTLPQVSVAPPSVRTWSTSVRSAVWRVVKVVPSLSERRTWIWQPVGAVDRAVTGR